MSYIVKNCPAITNNLTCWQAIYENMFCDYRTDCPIKQVIEKCELFKNNYLANNGVQLLTNSILKQYNSLMAYTKKLETILNEQQSSNIR